MQLLAVAALQPLLAGAQRQRPVGADLDVLVAGFERFVVEGVALGGGVARRPDQRLVRVGEAPAAKVRHRVRLPPHHVVENPEAEVLQDRADAEDVVIGADHPQRAGRLEHALAGGKPGAGELVVGREARELVPVVVDRVDLGIVGALEVALELKIVRRIGEHEVDRARPAAVAISSTQSPKMMFDAMRAGSGAATLRSKLPRGALRDAPRRDTTMTQNSDSGDAVGDAGPTNRRRE